MKTTTEYTVSVEIRSQSGETRTLEYEASFYYDEGLRGKKTYLDISPVNSIGTADYYFDLRFEPDYDRDRKICFLATWADYNWTGDRGSWKLVGCNIHFVKETEKDE